MAETLFVYGTLKRRSSAHALLRDARFLASASIRGRLYDLGKYPGLVRGRARESKVSGELYELSDAVAPILLRELDRYEGSEFVRRRVFVTLPNGKRRGAWTYLLRTRPAKSVRTVPSGRYPL